MCVAGETIDTVTWLKGSETFYSGDLAGAVFFGGTTLLAEGLGGVWTGDTTLPEVVLWRVDTLPVAVVRWTGSTGVPVSEQRREELWRAWEASLPGAEREIVSHLRGLVPFAETVPEFGAIEVSPDGTLWIGAPVPPERQLLDEPWPAQEWLLVDVDARAAGRLETPEGVRVSRVGSDFVLGVHTDQLGVESVRLHRIEWSRPDRE